MLTKKWKLLIIFWQLPTAKLQSSWWCCQIFFNSALSHIAESGFASHPPFLSISSLIRSWRENRTCRHVVKCHKAKTMGWFWHGEAGTVLTSRISHTLKKWGEGLCKGKRKGQWWTVTTVLKHNVARKTGSQKVKMKLGTLVAPRMCCNYTSQQEVWIVFREAVFLQSGIPLK